MIRLHMRSFVKSVSFFAAFSLLLNFIAVPKAAGQKRVENRLITAFQDAAKESEVPWELIAAIAYAETHFYENNGPSSSNGYGLMHLVDNTHVNTLEVAAKLTGIPVQVLMTDTAANIRGGAALLSAYADEKGLTVESRRNLGAWYEVVARYSNATDPTVARLYADEVDRLMKSGFSGTSRQDEVITVPATEFEQQRGYYETVVPMSSPDYLTNSMPAIGPITHSPWGLSTKAL